MRQRPRIVVTLARVLRALFVRPARIRELGELG